MVLLGHTVLILLCIDNHIPSSVGWDYLSIPKLPRRIDNFIPHIISRGIDNIENFFLF